MALYRSFTRAWPRPCIVEMGGKNPAIVTGRADLDEAAEGERHGLDVEAAGRHQRTQLGRMKVLVGRVLGPAVLRLDQGHRPGARPAQCEAGRQDGGQADEARIAHDRVDRVRHSGAVQRH